MRPRASLLLTTLAALLASSHSHAENAEAAPAGGAENPSPASLPVLPTEGIRLSNGLRVLLAPDAGARLVSIVVSYAAGAADDPNGLNGLAHLTEHFAARRTAHI